LLHQGGRSLNQKELFIFAGKTIFIILELVDLRCAGTPAAWRFSTRMTGARPSILFTETGVAHEPHFSGQRAGRRRPLDELWRRKQ
jgi:hypothetical protein